MKADSQHFLNTAGGSGIGALLAKTLAEKGALVVVLTKAKPVVDLTHGKYDFTTAIPEKLVLIVLVRQDTYLFV